MSDSSPAEFAPFVQGESTNLLCWAASVFVPGKPMCFCIQLAQSFQDQPCIFPCRMLQVGDGWEVEIEAGDEVRPWPKYSALDKMLS